MGTRRTNLSGGTSGDPTDLTSLLSPDIQRRVRLYQTQEGSCQPAEVHMFGPGSPGWTTDTVTEAILRDWYTKYQGFNAKTRSVFAAVARGLGNGAIAEQLHIPYHQVSIEVSYMYETFGLKNIGSAFDKRSGLVHIHTCLATACLVGPTRQG